MRCFGLARPRRIGWPPGHCIGNAQLQGPQLQGHDPGLAITSHARVGHALDSLVPVGAAPGVQRLVLGRIPADKVAP